MILSAHQIRNILPYKYPFVFLDGVKSYTQNIEIESYKNVTISENCFNGHMTDFPIFPGVLIIECIAQTCSLHSILDTIGFKTDAKTTKPVDDDIKIGVLGAVDITFYEPVFPGHKINIIAKVDYERFGKRIYNFETFIENGGKNSSGKLVVGQVSKSQMQP